MESLQIFLNNMEGAGLYAHNVTADVHGIRDPLYFHYFLLAPGGTAKSKEMPKK